MIVDRRHDLHSRFLTLSGYDRFVERHAHFVTNGYTGRALYEQLAADTSLPLYFSPKDAARIAGVGVDAMAKRRHRKMAPSYISLSNHNVQYTRPDLCGWLASLFVDRNAA